MKVTYVYRNLGPIFSGQKKPAKALDATLKFLRDKAVSQQEKQARRSKNIAGIAYLGINNIGDLRFACRSEDGTETYLQSIRFYDLHKRKPRTRDEILRMMRESDVGVYCNDPSFLYWGAAYNATKGRYNIVIENRPPTRSLAIKNNFALCKHLIAVTRAVPFYWNNMVKDYGEYFKLPPEEQAKIEAENPVKEVEKNIGQAKAEPVKPAQAVSTKVSEEDKE